MGGDRRPLKVLHIDPERKWGGGERQVMGLVSYLSLWGHRNDLLCDPRGPLFREAQEKGLRVFPLTVRNELDVRPVFSLRRIVRQGAYDIIHFHTKRAHALARWLGGFRPAVKFVVTRRMDYPLRGSWVDRRLYNRSVDGVIAISQKIADVLIQWGVKKDRVRVIHSGIDPEPFEKARGLRPNSDRPVVGTVATLEERKGHRFLVEAAALLKQQGHRLLFRFAGQGSERERLRKIALRLGLEDEVVFEGFLGDIPAFLSTVDIFVLPSLHEGLGVAVLEAMAAAKPVVATRVGGLPELVEDELTGFLVPPGDPNALARSIARLVGSRALAEEMGKRAREQVRSQFTMEQMAWKNMAYYYDLLEARG